MNKPSGFPLKRVGGLSALAGTAVLGLSVLASQGVVAHGNPDFEGIISAADPTGFMSSPDAYDVSGGPVTVDFNVATTNLTNQSQSIALNFSAHHILTYNGADVSDGQPGQPGITFNGPTGTTQALMPGSQAFTATWDPNGSTDNVGSTIDSFSPQNSLAQDAVAAGFASLMTGAPPPTSVQQEVLGLYAALYNRATDFGCVSYWVDVVGHQPDGSGVTTANAGTMAITVNDATVLGQQFVNTQNTYFNATYGSLSDSAFITALYVNLAGNATNIAAGIGYWANLLQAAEAAGQSVQSARAGLIGQIVHDMIDYNVSVMPAGRA